MLIFYRLFLKPFYKTKKKFSLYFILIFILTFSFCILFSFHFFNKSNIEHLNYSSDTRKIEVTNLSKNIDITYLKQIKNVSDCYPVYDEVNISYPFAELSTVQNDQFDYESFLIMGSSVNENNYEIVLPNHIVLNGEQIDLTSYYNTILKFIYSVNKKDYILDAKVVGIYDNYDNSSYVVATTPIFKEISSSLSVKKYILIVDDILNMNSVLEETNKISNSYVIAYDEYEKSEKIILLNYVLDLIILFIGLMLLLVFSLLIRNLIYDLRNDIVILRAYGYSLFYIMRNIFFVVLLLFVMSYLLSNIFLVVFKIFFSKYINFEIVGFKEHIYIISFGIIITIFSILISYKRYKKQRIIAF